MQLPRYGGVEEEGDDDYQNIGGKSKGGYVTILPPELPRVTPVSVQELFIPHHHRTSRRCGLVTVFIRVPGEHNQLLLGTTLCRVTGKALGLRGRSSSEPANDLFCETSI
eukprot:sb/3477296/